MLDSIANLAQLRVVRQFMGVGSYPVIVMGDDVMEQVPSKAYAVASWKILESCGFDVKPGDSMIGQEGEFVRYVFGHDAVRGYPTRAIPSLVWRTEIMDIERVGINSAKEVVNQIMTAVGRGMDYDKLKTFMLQALHRILGDISVKWLYSPASLGGCGLVDGTKEEVVDYVFEFKYPEFMPDPRVTGDVPKHLDRWKAIRNLSGYISKLIGLRGGSYEAGKIIKVSKYDITQKRQMAQALTSNYTVIPIFNYIEKGLGAVTERVLFEFDQGSDVSVFFSESPMSVSTWGKLAMSAGRATQRMWLGMSLPYNPPLVMGVNPQLTAKVHKTYVTSSFDIVMSQHHITMTSIRNQAVLCERATAFGMSGNRWWTP